MTSLTMTNPRSPFPSYHYVAYEKLSPEQQGQVREHLLSKHLVASKLGDFAFLVHKITGEVTRAKGKHTLTEEANNAFWDNLRKPVVSVKGSLSGYTSGTRFTVSTK